MAQFARLRPVTLLIVESEAVVRIELAARLVGVGLVAFTASDADEAIRLLDAHPEIEIMLTDIGMRGDMDGMRLAHHVRFRWPPVKIIVMSGFKDIEPVDLPRHSVFLAKPFSPDALNGAIAKMVDSPAAQPFAC